MSYLFEKIYTNFKIEWSIDDLVKKFSGSITDPLVPYHKLDHAYSKADGSPHWQLFTPANISFGRNISINFPEEMNHVLDCLRNVQKELKHVEPKSDLLNIFLNHTFDLSRINLTKIEANHDVQPHCDKTHTTSRDLALNIGLQNSSNCITYIGDHDDIKTFWDKPTERFIMEDGDIYLLATKNAHAVKVNPEYKNTGPRYVVSYTLVGRGYTISGTKTDQLIIQKIS